MTIVQKYLVRYTVYAEYLYKCKLYYTNVPIKCNLSYKILSIVIIFLNGPLEFDYCIHEILSTNFTVS